MGGGMLTSVALLLAMLRQGEPVVFPGRFVEESVPNATQNEIEALVLFRKLGPRDRAAEELLAGSLLGGAKGYNHDEMRAATVDIGEPLRVQAYPDCLRITIGTASNDLESGLEILHALLTGADLSDDSFAAARESLVFQRKGPWEQALDPADLPFRKITRHEMEMFYNQNVVPEATSIVVTGPYSPGQARSAWLELVSDWQDPKGVRMAPEIERTTPMSSSQGPVSTLRLQGPQVTGSTIPVALLAAYALGVGKESSVFRILRQRDRISYRQEAYLQGEGPGFCLCIATAFLPREDEAGLGERIRAELVADVEHWSDVDRSRALALASTTLTGWPNLVPLNLTGLNGPSAQDRSFLEAYWPMKTGEAWNPAALLSEMQSVSLENLKKMAKSALLGAQATLVSAKASG